MSNPVNEIREQQILETAADLFVHYGYDKTTVGDIAREAGISKSAFYLHFKNKEQLLEELLHWKLKAYAINWIQRIEDDPAGGSIGGMYKNMMYSLDNSPFMAAIFRQDERILGTYLRQPNNFFAKPQRSPSSRYTTIKLMQDAGAVRDDLDAKVIAYIINMLSYALVAMHDVVPQEEIPATEEIIEGIATIMDGALTPPNGSNSEAGKRVIRQMTEAARQRSETA